jgi:hypothetical protein
VPFVFLQAIVDSNHEEPKAEELQSADFDRALERGDNERGVRHANRIYMIDERLWIEAPVGRISGYTDLSTERRQRLLSLFNLR